MSIETNPANAVFLLLIFLVFEAVMLLPLIPMMIGAG